MAKSFKVGEAPWEKEEKASFKVGEAPWEKEQVPEETPMVTGKGLLKGTLEALPVAGGLVGGALGTVAGPLGTIGGAGLGAGAGKALENLGEKYLLGEEKTREDIYAQPAKATLEGVTAEMGGQLIGPAVQGAAKGLKNIAETQAFKSTGAMLKDFRQAASKDQVNEIGRFILDKKIVKPGDSFGDVAEKALTIKEQAGKKIGDIYKRAASAIPDIHVRSTGFNPIRDKEEMLSTIKKSMGNEVGARAAVDDFGRYLDELAESYGDTVLDPATANEVKGAIDRVINYSRNPLNKQPVTEKAFSSARRILEGKIAKDIDFLGAQLGDESLSKTLREANKEFGTSANVYNIANDRVQRESANQMFGLTDTIAGGAGTTIGAVLGGAPGAVATGLLATAANKLGRTYGPGLVSGGADALSKGLLKSEKVLRKAPMGLVGRDAR